MKRDINELAHAQFDLCVVGAGIQGACLAWEASLSGLQVALIDAHDFGGMTSHNSYKLIHGGFRYLQQFDLLRIRQSMREQAFWLRNAPGYVQPLQFVMPTYGHALRGPEALTMALLGYRALTRIFSPHHHKLLPHGRVYSRQTLSQLVPDLSVSRFNGAATWFDGQMQEADRLIIRILQQAAGIGLVAANYARADHLLCNAGAIRGVAAVDETTGREIVINTRAVAVCAGPQTHQFLRESGVTGLPEELPWIKGINVTVSGPPLRLCAGFGDTSTGLHCYACEPIDVPYPLGRVDNHRYFTCSVPGKYGRLGDQAIRDHNAPRSDQSSLPCGGLFSRRRSILPRRIHRLQTPPTG